MRSLFNDMILEIYAFIETINGTTIYIKMAALGLISVIIVFSFRNFIKKILLVLVKYVLEYKMTIIKSHSINYFVEFYTVINTTLILIYFIFRDMYYIELYLIVVFQFSIISLTLHVLFFRKYIVKAQEIVVVIPLLLVVIYLVYYLLNSYLINKMNLQDNFQTSFIALLVAIFYTRTLMTKFFSSPHADEFFNFFKIMFTIVSLLVKLNGEILQGSGILFVLVTPLFIATFMPVYRFIIVSVLNDINFSGVENKSKGIKNYIWLFRIRILVPMVCYFYGTLYNLYVIFKGMERSYLGFAFVNLLPVIGLYFVNSLVLYWLYLSFILNLNLAAATLLGNAEFLSAISSQMIVLKSGRESTVIIAERILKNTEPVIVGAGGRPASVMPGGTGQISGIAENPVVREKADIVTTSQQSFNNNSENASSSNSDYTKMAAVVGVIGTALTVSQMASNMIKDEQNKSEKIVSDYNYNLLYQDGAIQNIVNNDFRIAAASTARDSAAKSITDNKEIIDRLRAENDSMQGSYYSQAKLRKNEIEINKLEGENITHKMKVERCDGLINSAGIAKESAESNLQHLQTQRQKMIETAEKRGIDLENTCKGINDAAADALDVD